MSGEAERNWLDSWLSTILEGVDYKVDMIGAYGMMNGACEEERKDNASNL